MTATPSHPITSSPLTARRLPARDRVWSGLRTAFVWSTAAPLDADGVRARLAELAAAEPQLRFFSVPDADRPDRVLDAADAAAAAARVDDVPLVPIGHRDPARVAETLLNRESTGPQVEVATGSGLTAVSYPHVLGDALAVLKHARRLLIGPDPAAAAASIAGASSSAEVSEALACRRPVLTALRRRFTSVESVRTLLREPRPAVPTGAGPSASALSVGVVYALLPKARVAEVKAWRREHRSEASVFTCVMTAAWQAALQAGLGRPGDGAVVAYDLRTELPAKTPIDANFVGASYVLPADVTDPDAVHRAVVSAKASGRALVGLALATARESLRRRTPWPALPAPDPTPVLSFCHMRVDRAMPRQLTAGEDGQPLLCVATVPASAGSIGFFLLDVGTQMHLSVVFWDPCTDRRCVQAAVDALVADPLRFLPTTPPSSLPPSSLPSSPASPAVS